MDRDFSYFFDWQSFDGYSLLERMAAEFADNGAKNIVITPYLLERFASEPNFFFYFTSIIKKHGLKYAGCHGLWSGVRDLNGEDRFHRKKAIENHKIAMGYAADAGCKSYVMHIGALCCYYRPYDEQKMRDLACGMLEELLPAAEKEGIVIAVENSFEPTNSADEVLYYINRFPSPWIGVCYDSGHANMVLGKGKDPSKYGEDMTVPWDGRIVFDDHSLAKLAPHIVTCHLHDNHGYSDEHLLPGAGTIDWADLIGRLSECPRIQNMQVETKDLPELSIRKLCTTMEQFKKYMK